MWPKQNQKLDQRGKVEIEKGGRWCCVTGVLAATGEDWLAAAQAGLGPRNPQIASPQHSVGRLDLDCGFLSSKYTAGRQPGAGGWESTGAQGAAGSGGWPTFALTPTSQQTGPDQNQGYELEGARSKKSCPYFDLFQTS